MVKLKPTILIVITLSYLNLLAQMSFTENKGQWPNQVEYRLNSTLHQVYFEKDGFTFNLIDGEDLFSGSVHHGNHNHKHKRKDKLDAYAYKMQFIDANQTVKIKGVKAYSAYENFFIGNDKNHWARNVKSYQEIYYKELYSSIDLRIYQQAKGFKYDFIVKAGADIREIQMNYKGVEKFTLSNGNLKIVTPVGKIFEKKPYVYQIIKGKTIEVEAEYVLWNNIVSFRLLEKYDENYDLIIDPSLVFSTYSGSTLDNWGFTATGDKLGNVYSGGIVFNAGYPTTQGAYQYNFAGGEAVNSLYYGSDISISKYTPDGTTLLWATHLGGASSEEMPHSLVVNESNELVILGTTGSTDFPTTSGAYDRSFNGGTNITYDNVVKFSKGTDIIISKLSADGSHLTASTYIGGSENDGINWRDSYIPYTMEGNGALYYNYADGARGEIITDLKSDIFVGTTTFSKNFPVVNGFQLSPKGEQEGVVFKLSSDLTQLIWSSYLGGTEDDAIYSLDINKEGETYVAGGTVSHDFPTTAGAYKTAFQGGTTDGFVAHISADGHQLLASTYFGSSEYDQAYFVRIDRFKNVFITGQTKASGSTLIHNAVYNKPNSGQFISKFYAGLSTLDWSTVFGTGKGKPNISISAFSVDICNRIYLSGWGREWGSNNPDSPYYWGKTFGTKNMEVTSDAEQSTTDGQDFYIMVLFGDASALDYATFFGEPHYGSGYCGHDHVDGGTSRFDKMGNIYQSVCSSCGNIDNSGSSASCNEFPTTTGAAFEDNGGIVNEYWVCNNAVFRFSFAEDITVADFYAEPIVCENIPIQFTNTGSGANYYWDFGDGTTSTEENPSHLFPAPGSYNIQLYTIDSNTCNLTDTIIKSILIQDQVSKSIDTANMCLGSQVQIGIPSEENHNYFWTPDTDLSDAKSSDPFASPSISTNYTLAINDGICLDTIWQTVNVINVQYNLEALKDTIICYGDTVELLAVYNTSVDSIQWSSYSDFSDVLNLQGTDNIFVAPDTLQNYYVQTFDSVCQVQRQDSVWVNVDIPQIELSGDSMVCINDTTNFSVHLINGDVSSIYWSPVSKIITGQGSSVVTVFPDASFWLSVEVENTLACTVTDSIFIIADKVQAFYVKEDLLCYEDCIGKINLTYTGIEPFSFVWDNGMTEDSLSDLCAGSYAVTITDSLSCTDTLQVEILQPTLLQTQITDSVNTGCDSLWDIGSATATATGGTIPYTYLWSNGDTTETADSLHYGMYYLTVEDANKCSVILSVMIDDTSSLEVIHKETYISCYGDCDASAYLSIVTESFSPYTYEWSNGATSDSVYNLCPGDYEYTVSDANACKRINFISFIEPDSLVMTLNIDHQACFGDTTSALVLVDGGTIPYAYLWSNGDTTETAVNLVDGDYIIKITDSHGCILENAFVVQSPDTLILDTLKTKVNCETACNGTAELQVSGGEEPYSYLWDNGSEEAKADTLCLGKHYVTLTDASGCIVITDVTIDAQIDGVPVEAYASPRLIYQGTSSQLTSTVDENYTYSWQPTDVLSNSLISNPVARIFETTVFKVTVEDSVGCVNSDTAIVYVKNVICDEPYIYVPNAFSPNDDGENDILYVHGEMIEELQFSVYDRWGELVFNTNDINHGWNGIYQGRKADPAVFVYYLKATCINRAVFEKKGNITVVK